MVGAFVAGEIVAYSMDHYIIFAAVLIIVSGAVIYLSVNKKIKKWSAVICFIIEICFVFGGYNLREQLDNFSWADGIKDGDTICFSGFVTFSEKQYNSYKEEDIYEMQVVTDRGIVLVYATDAENIKYGHQIYVQGNVKSYGRRSNPGGFDEYSYLRSKNIILKVDADFVKLCSAEDDYNHCIQFMCEMSHIFDKSLAKIADEDSYGLLSAILLGRRYSLEDDVKELYGLAGISHILTISGLHISVIGMGIYKMLRRWLKYAPAGCISSCVMLMYLIVSGASLPAVRAVVMFLVHILADILGRKYDTVSAMSLSAMVILTDNPAALTNVSFQLSYMAIIAVTLISPVISSVFSEKRFILKAVLFNLVLNLTMLPLNEMYFYRVPTYGIIENIIALPFMSIMLLMSLMAMIVGVVNINVAQFMVGSGVYILDFFTEMSKFFTKLPFASVVTGTMCLEDILIYYFLLAFVVIYVKKAKYFRKIVLLCVFFFLVVLGYSQKNEGFYVTYLDVGQGDSIHIHSESGINYLIDGGSTSKSDVGKYVIESYLEYMDVSRLDYVFISHFDKDHISGIQELIYRGNIDIGTIIVSETESEYMDSLAGFDGDIVFFQRGDTIRDQKMEIRCIGPQIGEQYEDINEASQILVFTADDVSLVFTGDIGADTEKRLTKKEGDYSLDCLKDSSFVILKVAHHGSKNSTTNQFLEKVNPQIAVISYGENNYGHPFAETKKRLESAGAEIYETGKNGAVTIWMDEGIRIKTMLED